MEIGYEIRQAIQEDAAQIAEVHIRSWRETYPGIMPAEKMASLSLDKSLANWKSTLSDGSTMFVATVKNRIVGFISGGINRSNSDCETGLGDACEAELAALYVLQDYHKLGIGRALMKKFTAAMQTAGFKSMVAWVAEKNPATGFYAAMGGEYCDRKQLMVCQVPVSVIAYRYSI